MSTGQSKRLNEALVKALAFKFNEDDDEEENVLNLRDEKDSEVSNVSLNATSVENSEADSKTEDDEMDNDAKILLPFSVMTERAKYIPLRLTYEERKSFRLVNACVTVSDYTTTVDNESFKNDAKRNHCKLQNICGFLSGIIASCNYEDGQKVLEDRNFSVYENLLQEKLEISRRYKIMNPEKMRSEYGKLLMLMQDAESTDIKPLLGVEINSPIKTVYDLLASKDGLKLLQAKLIHDATQEVLPDKNKSRSTIQNEIRRKEKSIEILCQKYQSFDLSADDIRKCLYSISDNNSYLNSNLLPIQECITLLKKYFHPNKIETGYSLAIVEGGGGARLTHSHERQYNYVLQSLTLWASIVQDMFRLWYLAELDLLSSQQPYTLQNTGQGLQRVQQSPRVYKAMHEILSHTQQQLGVWIGSSVIHLGDRNVPNALVFIDKYTQVSRILGPLIKTLNMLDIACEENEGLHRYMAAYGGIDKAKKDVLHDFFTHAFDGSGGDNFFDAGSCIDGRLTSAWHWCSQLSSKPYYPLFRLSGFLSFDGEFDK